MLHNGYRLGHYWKNIGAMRDERMPCHECEEPVESMDHILRECRVSGQATVWKLAKELWVTGLDRPRVALRDGGNCSRRHHARCT
ncbi:hypothetical protein DFP72DRAFT_920581 [Ephemerocybe angulata]|uniref:Reverse transcriptase zinc-binding domain-containing protein n=1 Tax=Ephemerocybe angulata TaxID=980116 RepID=A0A8H6HJ41_9AGAR|nr:hypothetical protein DFP72DRAFT_920581 [Tulosesus angulatus]